MSCLDDYFEMVENYWYFPNCRFITHTTYDQFCPRDPITFWEWYSEEVIAYPNHPLTRWLGFLGLGTPISKSTILTSHPPHPSAWQLGSPHTTPQRRRVSTAFTGASLELAEMTTPDQGQGGWEPPSTAEFNRSNQPRLGIWMSTTWDLDEMTHISLPTLTLEKCWDSLLVNSLRNL